MRFAYLETKAPGSAKADPGALLYGKDYRLMSKFWFIKLQMLLASSVMLASP